MAGQIYAVLCSASSLGSAACLTPHWSPATVATVVAAGAATSATAWAACFTPDASTVAAAASATAVAAAPGKHEGRWLEGAGLSREAMLQLW